MLVHWIWLATRPDMSDREKMSVLEHFSDPEDIFYADEKTLRTVEGIRDKAVEALLQKDLKDAARILRQCADKGIHVCTCHDGSYPSRLKHIDDPPMVLYCKGILPDFDSRPVISVVGTRKASGYGIKMAKQMGYQIARCGGIVVSGAAMGIDGEAMAGALMAGGGVVGVLGCGVDVIYPKGNRSLLADTERYGCLISEFPPETQPYKWNFPKRNRIISGLANGVLIVEAPKLSGALITARMAADQGRDVFVIPGNVDVDTCEGSNALLREGAIAVRSGWDVVGEYAALYPENVRQDHDGLKLTVQQNREKAPLKVAQKHRTPEKTAKTDNITAEKPVDNDGRPPYIDLEERFPGLSELELRILEPLRSGEMLIDDLIVGSGQSASSVLSVLTVLEIQGVVVSRPGNRIALK